MQGLRGVPAGRKSGTLVSCPCYLLLPPTSPMQPSDGPPHVRLAPGPARTFNRRITASPWLIGAAYSPRLNAAALPFCDSQTLLHTTTSRLALDVYLHISPFSYHPLPRAFFTSRLVLFCPSVFYVLAVFAVGWWRVCYVVQVVVYSLLC
ncbi:hypothetical protein OBBRIDRAFT_89952 [Obba rivulosa]|uniref:Uncharacterized protein n=1 Tax=Obba rivulosa TaxID=1052685 RepID=A0A8E2APQ5_9APHY|nr:hypothetical protein OBBRIDRAFT_89952 [Obba rivulosa]